MKIRARKVFLLVVVLLAILGGVVYLLTRPEPDDLRFSGLYQLDDGREVIVSPRVGRTLRLRIPATGESRALYPLGGKADLRYEAGPGWSEREPVEVEIEFRLGEDGRPVGFDWHHQGVQKSAVRIELEEEFFTLPSGELTLQGKLVLPPGRGPHPAVVIIHGSGADSAVDGYFMPYLFAPHGIATLVYDKRGTGKSAGSYSQNFHVLARDTVAAVEALQKRSDIDPERIHLSGYSQGGWIAPLAAAQKPGIRSLLINYGPMVPIADEDRWGYVYQLQRKGFGHEAIQEADQLHEIANDLMRGDPQAWDRLGPAFEKFEDRPWFEAIKGSDSTIGFIAGTKMPLWIARVYAWWRMKPVDGEPFAERFYDPEPTVASLDLPSLWIFGGEDSSMPSEWSIDKLEPLREQGKPIEILVYPHAEHGILLIEEKDDERVLLWYPSSYMSTQVSWLRYQSGLDTEFELPR